MNKNPNRRSVNLLVSAELLEEARWHRVNVSSVLEMALRHHMRQIRRERWLRNNTHAIAAYNQAVEIDSLLADALRQS